VAELYVATDEDGRQAHLDAAVHWPLPAQSADDVVPGAALTGQLTLFEPRALLGRLDRSIHLAEATEPGAAGAGGDDGTHVVPAARLVRTTPWDGYLAAGFALDCAEHVLGDAGDLPLPDGTPLRAALARVREWLTSAEADDGVTGRFRDLAVAWRVKRQGKAIGDVAFGAWTADLLAEVDAMEDPVWTAVAAARDAALAAVEAVQHAHMPVVATIESDSYEAVGRHVDQGGGLHRHAPTSWVPYWVATDDAAERARQAAGAAGGPDGAAAELEWQAARLVELLSGGGPDEGAAADHR
jgi:hypothetical protein